jgi:small subunit ribosomal protein S6
MTIRVEEIDAEAPSAILSRKSDDRERGFRGPKPPGRFDSGRKRGYDDREEFRARDSFGGGEGEGGFNERGGDRPPRERGDRGGFGGEE